MFRVSICILGMVHLSAIFGISFTISLDSSNFLFFQPYLHPALVVEGENSHCKLPFQGQSYVKLSPMKTSGLDGVQEIICDVTDLG